MAMLIITRWYIHLPLGHSFVSCFKQIAQLSMLCRWVLRWHWTRRTSHRHSHPRDHGLCIYRTYRILNLHHPSESYLFGLGAAWCGIITWLLTTGAVALKPAGWAIRSKDFCLVWFVDETKPRKLCAAIPCNMFDFLLKGPVCREFRCLFGVDIWLLGCEAWSVFFKSWCCGPCASGIWPSACKPTSTASSGGLFPVLLWEVTYITPIWDVWEDPFWSLYLAKLATNFWFSTCFFLHSGHVFFCAPSIWQRRERGCTDYQRG